MAAYSPTETQPLSAIGLMSVVRPAFDPTAMKWLEGRSVVRCPEQLRLHRALDELGWPCVLDDLDDAARRKYESAPEPILITTDGTILSGFGPWRLAVFDGRHEIDCIEYPIGEENSLQFILRYHQPRRTWNAYVRICMALTLEPYFQQQALENMRAGGKYKGLANLPNPYRIDVREEIAALVGVSPRLVGNVKMIQRAAHSRILEALRDGTLKINGGMQLCKLPKDRQLDQFIRCQEERATNRVIRRSIRRPTEEKNRPAIAAILEALLQQESRQPGSVLVRESSSKRSIISVGEGLDVGSHPQTDEQMI